MKKFYSLVLMAAALLIGTNAWAAQVRNVGTAEQFETAWKALQNGDEIRLTGDVSVGKTLWLGTTTMADLNPMSITLNLNGHELTGTATKMFVITHGELNVISENGEGVIEHTAGQGKMSSTYEIFRVLGSTYKDVDPKNLGENQKYYSHLTIGENVKLIASNNAVVVDQANTVYPTSDNAWAAGNVTIPSTDAAKQKLYTNVYRSDRGVAHGVCIDIKGKIEAQKYAIKANGNLGVPTNHTDATYPKSYHYQDRNNAAYEIVEGEQNVYSPFIHIHSSAELLTKNFTSTAAIAAYSGGYTRWLVEGTCIGSTGVYVKSGELVINNAVVASNYTGTYQPAGESERSSGVDAGGSGIVMETAKAYAGEMDVTVQGDTKVSGTVGYAIDEAVSPQSDSTKVDAITITGGTFESGDQGTMRVTEITAEANADPTQETIITIIGGSADNTSTTIGNQSLVEFLSDQAQEPGKETHITYVENEEGKTVMVISQGEEPLVNNKVSDASADASIKWQGELYVNDTIKNNLKLAELEINDTLANGNPRTQVLVINAGKTLEAGRVVLGKGAQIIVEAGAKFIVTGAQGIVAPVTSNIVLRANSTAQATFLFNPAVSSNRHPKATVDMTAMCGIDPITNEDVWTRFAVLVDSLDSPWEKKYGYGTWLYGWDYEANEGAGEWAPVPGGNKGMKPWTGYTLSYNETTEEVYTVKGSLVGNANAQIKFVHEGYNYFGNSYSSYMDAKTLVQGLADSHIDGTIYMWDVDNQQYASVTMNTLVNYPNHLDADWQKDIAPMQTFILQLRGANSASESLNYNDAIWNNPRYGKAGTIQAPRRTVANVNEDTYIKMVITSANGKSDRINLTEGADYSDAYESGYDAAKFMNERSINIYASVDGENYSDVATDNLEGKTISLQTLNEANYTISFKVVEGEEYALLDKATNKVVAIEEGTTYEFAAQPNSVVEGRFEIVKVSKVATDIENTEVKANAKGIYTIMGQYVGEDFEALPAGIYVVDGVKIVK